MGADGSEDDDEERPAGKKAKAATPVANGNGVKRGEVKSEPGLDREEEVNFF